MKKKIVVAAIIKDNDEYLCTQRAEGKHTYTSGKYEFPGGKVEAGETYKEALIREIREELSMEIIIGEKITLIKHQYPDFFLELHCYNCTCQKRELKLNVHINYKWLNKKELKTLNWTEADLPLIDLLIG